MACYKNNGGDRGRSKDKHRQKLPITTTRVKDVGPVEGNTGEKRPLTFREILKNAKQAEAKA